MSDEDEVEPFMTPPTKSDVLSRCRSLNLQMRKQIIISHEDALRCLGSRRYSYLVQTDPQGPLRFSDTNNILALYWKPSELDENWISSKRDKKRMKRICGYIRNQQQHLLCWAYATCDLISASLVVYGWKKRFIPLSPQYLCNKMRPDTCKRYVKDEKVKFHTCYGNNVFSALKYVKSNGIPKERKQEFECYRERRHNGAERLYNIDSVFEYNTLEQALGRLKSHPVSAGMICFTGWNDPGIYRGPMKRGAEFVGFHEVLMIDCRKVKNEMVIRCKSSNGEETGNEGYIFVSLDVMLIVAGADAMLTECPTKPSYLLFDFHSVSMKTGPRGLKSNENPNQAIENLKFKMHIDGNHEVGESSRKLKVVLRSATDDADLFSRYFSQCPVITAQGRRHPVTTHFLEEIYKRTKYLLAPDSPAALRSYSSIKDKVQYQHVAEMEAAKAGMPTVSVNHDTGGGSAVRDIHMDNFIVSIGGRDLILDGSINLSFGRHYGLVGRNGTGKTTFLRDMAMHAIEGIPANCQILHVEQEVVGDNTTTLQCVLKTDIERTKLLEEETQILAKQREMELEEPTVKEGMPTKDTAEGDLMSLRLEEIYKRLDAIDTKGNYDIFERTREEVVKNQQKAFESSVRSRSHMQAFIDKFRYNAKRVSLVQSRIKALDRLAHVDQVINDPDYIFEFPTPDDKPGPPIISFSGASFGYPGGPQLFRNLNFGIDLDSRIAMVGANGIGKSTILNLISGELQPSSGTVFRSAKVRVAVFSQHHVDGLDLTSNPLLYMMRCYPGVPEQKLRSHLGSLGVTGNLALQPMYTLSGGQKSRVAFAKITFKKPHLLLLDEPSNHLDLDAVEALIQGLVLFQGGICMVSHDEHLISEV